MRKLKAYQCPNDELLKGVAGAWPGSQSRLLTSATTAFIIVYLDEESYQATGCSIDKLIRLIQDLEHELSISLMDRTQIAHRDDNGMIDTMHMTGFRAALESGDLG